MDGPVECAIAHIWESYSQPLSLADIAKRALLSRFHFSRVFRDATGVSPGRFLTAVRIYQAKRMLASTSMSVTDISFAVGYNSLGSFTNRFTDSVGVSPTRFRRLWLGMREAPGPAPGSPPPHGAVTGLVDLPRRYAAARVYVGAFTTPIVQCQPLSSAIVEAMPGRPTRYRLTSVPPGEWFIRAVAVADTADPEPWAYRSLLVGGNGSVRVTAGVSSEAGIVLRPQRPVDLPILFAVPDLETWDRRGMPGPEEVMTAGACPSADRVLAG